MKNKLRKAIKEEINKIFEGYFQDEPEYYSSFDVEDINDLKPGGSAYQAYLKDLEDEKELDVDKYKKVTVKELEDIVKGLQRANLELPNDKTLVKIAEKRLQTTLDNEERAEMFKIKDQMENLYGQNSYNQ